MAPGDVPTSTPPLPGTWRRRKRHGPWALRPPPTLEVPQESSVPPEITAAELEQPATPAELPGATSHEPPPEAATPPEHSIRAPGAFGSQLAASRDTPAANGSAAPTSDGPVARSGDAIAANDRMSGAALSMSIANTEIQSSVATEPSTEVLAIPATELQHPLGLLHPPHTALATMPDTMPPTEPTARSRRLAQDLDVRLAAPALRCSQSERGAHGTPGMDIDATPQTVTTAAGGSTVGDGGRWTMSGHAQARAQRAHPGSSGGPARTPELGGMSEAGSERPSGVTAIQEDAVGASPDTQPTPLLTQVEETQEGTAGPFGGGNGGSVGAGAATTDDGAVGDCGREREHAAAEEEGEAEEAAAEGAGVVGAGTEEGGVEEEDAIGETGSEVASEADGGPAQGAATVSLGCGGTAAVAAEPQSGEAGALHSACLS